jgi:hypothetical protein
VAELYTVVILNLKGRVKIIMAHYCSFFYNMAPGYKKIAFYGGNLLPFNDNTVNLCYKTILSL